LDATAANHFQSPLIQVQFLLLFVDKPHERGLDFMVLQVEAAVLRVCFEAKYAVRTQIDIRV
jgi:hypothetical protein